MDKEKKVSGMNDLSKTISTVKADYLKNTSRRETEKFL